MSKAYELNWLAYGLILLLCLGCEGSTGSNSATDPGAPDAPVITSLVASGDTLVMDWTAVADADSYNIYWGNGPGVTSASGTCIADVSPPYTLVGLTAGETYCVVVTATNRYGESVESGEMMHHMLCAPPTALTVTTGDGTATLQWNPAYGATSYNLYWESGTTVTKETGAKVVDVISPYTLTGLSNGESYAFMLVAVNGGGESGPSSTATVTLAPAAPTSISVTPAANHLFVSWTEVTTATSYNVYWDTVPGVSQTSASANLLAGVTPPLDHTGLINGTTYHYVVTAVGPGGESPDSLEAEGTPQVAAPGAPTNVTATVTEESTNSVTVSWDAPIVGIPTGYNLYFAENPGVSTADSALLNVTSPTQVIGLLGGTTYYFIVTAVDTGLGTEVESVEVSATARGPRKPGVGDTGFGNNLSYPVIFADGLGLGGTPLTGAWTGTDPIDPLVVPIDFGTGLRPLVDESFPLFPYWSTDSIYELNGVNYYTQKDAATWQGEWVDGSATEQHVTALWGDNLSSVSFTPNSVIRLEVGTEKTVDPAMTGYPMTLLFGAQTSEMQGTDGVAASFTTAQVFAANARLTIQKLDGPGGAVVTNGTVYDGALYENYGVDGPGGFGAEVNVGGKLVYGFVWFLRDTPTGLPVPGWWRLTFSLDDPFTVGGQVYANNLFIDAIGSGTLISPTQMEIEIEVRP